MDRKEFFKKAILTASAIAIAPFALMNAKQEKEQRDDGEFSGKTRIGGIAGTYPATPIPAEYLEGEYHGKILEWESEQIFRVSSPHKIEKGNSIRIFSLDESYDEYFGRILKVNFVDGDRIGVVSTDANYILNHYNHQEQLREIARWGKQTDYNHRTQFIRQESRGTVLEIGTLGRYGLVAESTYMISNAPKLVNWEWINKAINE